MRRILQRPARPGKTNSVGAFRRARACGGFLVVFFLATLGELYRYNLRPSYFNASRADALEFFRIRGISDPNELDKISGILAADKVELGKAATTPIDQAIKLAEVLRR